MSDSDRQNLGSAGTDASTDPPRVDPGGAPEGPPWGAMAGVAALSLFIVWLRDPATMPLVFDPQLYFHIAERAASGFSFHVVHFDAKTCFGSMLDALAIVAGRSAGISDVAAGRVLSAALLTASAVLAALVAWQIDGRRDSAMLSGLAFLSVAAVTEQGTMGFQPKLVLVFLILLTVALFDARRPLLMGVLAAACFLTWQPALIIAVGLLATLWLGGTGRHDWPVFATGFGVAFAIFEAYFFLAGSWRAQLEQNFYFTAFFMNSNFLGWTGSLESLYWIWTRTHGLYHLLPWIGLAGLVATVAGYVGKRGELRSDAHERPRRALLVFIALLGAAFTYYDHQGPEDLFLLLPAAAIFAALFLRSVARWMEGRLPHGRRIVIVGSALYFSFLAVYGTRRFQPKYTLQDQYASAKWVGRELEAGRGVFSVGAGHLLSFNAANNWTRMGFFFRGVAEYLTHRTGQPIFTPVRDGKWPDVYILGRYQPTGSDTWLERFYAPEPIPEFMTRQGLKVWRLQETKLADGEETPSASE